MEEALQTSWEVGEEVLPTSWVEAEGVLPTSWEEAEVGSQEEAPCRRSEVEEEESLRAEEGKRARLAEGGVARAASLQAWRVEEVLAGWGPVVEGVGCRPEVAE